MRALRPRRLTWIRLPCRVFSELERSPSGRMGTPQPRSDTGETLMGYGSVAVLPLLLLHFELGDVMFESRLIDEQRVW